MSSPATGAGLRLGFAGTPAFAARILEALISAGHAPVVVYTQPDRPRGRGRRAVPSAVKEVALKHALEVRQPDTVRGSAAAQELGGFELDVLIVAAYGLILPPSILGTPRLGCINVHASLLPRWRGAAPVERAIMAGDRETGVSIMQMDRGLDTGPVYSRRACAITDAMDGAALEDHLARLGADALLECLDELPGLSPVAQPAEGATYAAKLSREDAVIDWIHPATRVARQVRALRARLPAFTSSGDVRVTVLEAHVEPARAAPEHAPGRVVAADAGGIRVACGEDVLCITRLKLSVGKGRPLSAADAVNGYRWLFDVGTALGEAPEPSR